MDIYQYRVDFCSEIENDRMRMSLASLVAQHRSNFGCHCFDGSQIFSNMKLARKKIEFVSFTCEGKVVAMVVKFVRKIFHLKSTALQVQKIVLNKIVGFSLLKELTIGCQNESLVVSRPRKYLVMQRTGMGRDQGQIRRLLDFNSRF